MPATTWEITSGIPEAPVMFVGRVEERQLAASGSLSSLFVGEKGLGKSALLNRILADVSSRSEDSPLTCSVLIDLASERFNDVDQVIDYMIGALHGCAEGFREMPEVNSDLQSCRPSASTVLALLRDISASRQEIELRILLDNLEAFSSLRDAFRLDQELRTILDHAPPTSRVQVVGTATNAFLNLESWVASPLLSRLAPRYLSSLSEIEIEEYVAGVASALWPGPVSRDCIALLARSTGGHPYILHDVVRRSLATSNSRKTFEESLRAVLMRVGYGELFRQSIQHLTLEEYGLLQALALGFPSGHWEMNDSALNHIVSSGVARRHHGDGSLQATCGLFFEWVRARRADSIGVGLNRLSRPQQIARVIEESLPSAMRFARHPIDEESLTTAIGIILCAHGFQMKRDALVWVDRTAYRFHLLDETKRLGVVVGITEASGDAETRLAGFQGVVARAGAAVQMLVAVLVDETGRVVRADLGEVGNQAGRVEVLVLDGRLWGSV